MEKFLAKCNQMIELGYVFRHEKEIIYGYDTKDNSPVIMVLFILPGGEKSDRKILIGHPDGECELFPDFSKALRRFTMDVGWKEKFHLEEWKAKAGLGKLPEGLDWHVETYLSVDDPVFRLKVIKKGDPKAVVCVSGYYHIPLTEESYVSRLSGIAKKMEVPDYNPFTLNGV